MGHQCASCGEPVSGGFCSACGQPAKTSFLGLVRSRLLGAVGSFFGAFSFLVRPHRLVDLLASRRFTFFAFLDAYLLAVFAYLATYDATIQGYCESIDDATDKAAAVQEAIGKMDFSDYSIKFKPYLEYIFSGLYDAINGSIEKYSAPVFALVVQLIFTVPLYLIFRKNRRLNFGQLLMANMLVNILMSLLVTAMNFTIDFVKIDSPHWVFLGLGATVCLTVIIFIVCLFRLYAYALGISNLISVAVTVAILAAGAGLAILADPSLLHTFDKATPPAAVAAKPVPQPLCPVSDDKPKSLDAPEARGLPAKASAALSDFGW